MRIIEKIAAVTFCGLWLSGHAEAQETLGSLGAASGIGATLGAVGAGAITAGSATKKVKGGQDRNKEMDDLTREPSERSGGRGRGTSPVMPVTMPQPSTSNAIDWGTGNGQQIINQLLASKPLPQPVTVKRSPVAQSKYARRVSRMSKSQRTRMVMAKYHPAPVNWIAHYLPEDRFKITSGDWEVVSTETDKYYYKAWAPAMLRQTPNRVIGFHTWQNAMIAGYRPDPVTQPVPGAEFARLARIGRGEHFVEYVEYAYSGQVTPENFRATYNYALSVISAVNAYPYAKPLLPETLDTVFEATLKGDPSLIPHSIGGQPVSTALASVPGTPMSAETASNANAPRAGGAPPPEPEGQKDKREEEFNTFGSRAGKLANVPANR